MPVREQVQYTVLFEPAEEGGYVVTCPALPGLVTEGDTLAEARIMAQMTKSFLRILSRKRSQLPSIPHESPAAGEASSGASRSAAGWIRHSLTPQAAITF
jgi:antitoxin HicB